MELNQSSANIITEEEKGKQEQEEKETFLEKPKRVFKTDIAWSMHETVKALKSKLTEEALQIEEFLLKTPVIDFDAITELDTLVAKIDLLHYCQAKEHENIQHYKEVESHIENMMQFVEEQNELSLHLNNKKEISIVELWEKELLEQNQWISTIRQQTKKEKQNNKKKQKTNNDK